MTGYSVEEDIKVRVERYNKVLKRYPKLCYDKGWIYGVWYCSRPFKKQKYYGGYPLTYLKRLRALFGDMKPVLHLFSGMVELEEGEISVDNDPDLHSTYVAPAECLPLDNESVGVIFADPPYSREDAKKYKCKSYPKMKKCFSECARVLKKDGYLCFLHTHNLSVPRTLKLIGTIGIVTGTNAVSRLLTIYRLKSE